MKIKDMVVGQQITEELVLSSATIRRARNGKDFLQMTLTDGKDKLDGKIWDYNASQGVPEAPLVYQVTGTIGEYNGTKQITVSYMQISPDQDMTRFSAIYYPDATELMQYALKLIDSIENPQLESIVKGVYTTYADEIMKASSAKSIHHAGAAGNLAHSLEVAHMAEAIAKAIILRSPDNDYVISIDLCIAGALLHDLGKTKVYDTDDPGLNFTRYGREQDHIVLGIRMLDDYMHEHMPALYGCPEHDALVHIIASHHGSYEKGSPVFPTNMEAVIVNYADGLSATLNTMLLANRKAVAEKKPITDKLWTMENRQMTLQGDVLLKTKQ